MSLRYVNAFAPELPYTLREQVLDYARSVEAASHEIFREAEVKLTDELRDQLVLVAAVRKLHSICSTSYWLLYNSARVLGNDVSEVHIGGTTFSRESAHFRQLAILLGDLETLLNDQGLSIEIVRQPYPQILHYLANEREQDQ